MNYSEYDRFFRHWEGAEEIFDLNQVSLLRLIKIITGEINGFKSSLRFFPIMISVGLSYNKTVEIFSRGAKKPGQASIVRFSRDYDFADDQWVSS